jgi:ApaG protein
LVKRYLILFLNNLKMSIVNIHESIKIVALPHFQTDYSDIHSNNYAFSYHITIENTGDYTVQLLRRHWYIYNGNGTMTEVEGEGVIGQQPILEPGEKHSYTSGCNLPTNMGKMCGKYLMVRLFDQKQFYVTIPEMTMIVPHLLN